MRQLKNQIFFNRQSRSYDSGFTLVELLFVALLLALLSAILYGSLEGIIITRKTIEERQQSTATARYVIERMTREIASRAAEPISDPQGGENNNSQFQTVVRRYLSGKNLDAGSSDQDSLRFVSTSAAQAAMNGFPNAGLVEIEYRLEDLPDGSKQPEFDDDLKSYALVREEIPAGKDNKKEKEETKTGRIVFPLADNVVGLNFRYLRDGTWTDAWDGSLARFPEAIEITLRLRESKGKIATFRTAVAVNERRPQFAGFRSVGGV